MYSHISLKSVQTGNEKFLILMFYCNTFPINSFKRWQKYELIFTHTNKKENKWNIKLHTLEF